MPKLASPYLRPGRWKVTARYSVQVSRGKYLECVRVRGPCAPSGNAPVLHLSTTEFRRLFVKAKEKPRCRS